MKFGAFGRWTAAGLGALVAAGLVAGTGIAQEKTFSGLVEVNTVNVDVMVTRRGEPVTDLTKEDFEIWEDGVPQTITNFAKVQDGVVYLDAAGQPIEDAKDLRYRRHVALVFDLNFVDKPWVARAVESLKEYVRQRGGDDVDWTVMAVGANPVVLVPYTSDVEAVIAGLDAVRGQPTYRLGHALEKDLFYDPMGTSLLHATFADVYSQQISAEQERLSHYRLRSLTARSLNVYLVLARGLVDIFRNTASTPGKKACLLITGNMDLNPRLSLVANNTPQTYPPQSMRGFDPQLASAMSYLNDVWDVITRYANTAGFRIYAVNAMALDNPMTYIDVSNRITGGPSPSASAADWDTLPRMLTDATGGRYLNTNTVTPAIEAVDHELKTYYSLAYQARHGHDNQYHKIKVKIRDRKGLEVRYRAGYYDLEPELMLAEQLLAPAQFTKVGGTLPMAVRVDTRRAGDHLEVSATAVTPLGQLAFLPEGDQDVGQVSILMTIYDPSGKVLDLKKHRQTVKIPSGLLEKAKDQPFTYTMKFSLPEGEYTVAMALHDRVSGASGMANARVIAP